MTTLAGGDVELLRSRIGGSVLTPSDGDSYDRARSVWNGAIDRRPAVIAQCDGAADVAAAIAFARDLGLEIAVRGGAHNVGGAAVVDDGLVIDLTPTHQVTVDPETRTVRCGGGATLAQLDGATQLHGLACAAGTISHTGVGGLTLGGGFGWLTSVYGLACDNMIAAELVTAEGQVLTVSETQHPELMWALRGGGGNFGVVTRFDFQAHPVGPIIHFGMLFYELDRGPEALALAQQATASLPGSTGALIAALNAPPEPFVPEEHHLRPGYAILVAGFGAQAEHDRFLDEIGAGLEPLFEFRTPMPFVELQRMLDDAAPWGILSYEKALYISALTPDVIATVCEHVPRKQSPMSIVPIFPMNGAYSAVADDATAFGGIRTPGMAFNIDAVTAEPDVLDAETAWARELYNAMLPYGVGLGGGTGGYVNFMQDYQQDRVRASFGPTKYARLARIKRAYDPDNIFHRNPNINPAG